jgi:hypothetical protein
MNTLRQLLLLAAAVIAAMALTTGSALAEDEGVEVNEELADGVNVHCDPWCDIHAEGNSALTVHIGAQEFVVSACSDEFEGEIDENGEGQVNVYNNADTPQCTRQNCNGVGEPASESVWPGHVEEENMETTGHIVFCLDNKGSPNSSGVHCEIEIQTEDLGDHTWHFAAVDESCPVTQTGINIEIDGEWQLEQDGPTDPHDNIEVIH